MDLSTLFNNYIFSKFKKYNFYDYNKLPNNILYKNIIYVVVYVLLYKKYNYKNINYPLFDTIFKKQKYKKNIIIYENNENNEKDEYNKNQFNKNIPIELFNNIKKDKINNIIFEYTEKLILLNDNNRFLKFTFKSQKDMFYKIVFSINTKNVKNIIIIYNDLVYDIIQNNIFIKDISKIDFIIDNLSFDSKEVNFYIIFYNNLIYTDGFRNNKGVDDSNKLNNILDNISKVNYENIELSNISINVYEKNESYYDNSILLLNLNNTKYIPTFQNNCLKDNANKNINIINNKPFFM